jgi:hypothetical protein
LLLQPKGQLSTAEQYNNLIINNPAKDGGPIYLKDVAKAVDSIQDERINMRFWARGYGTPRQRWWSRFSARPGRTPSTFPSAFATWCRLSMPSCRLRS